MPRRKLLDLFCGAGAASVGYERAGFDVTGVDWFPQSSYPFDCYLADAMTFPLDGFDVVHASPPCQRYSHATPHRTRAGHPDLLDAIFRRLVESGLPFIVENVPLSPMVPDVVLCGSMFGLTVRRHRWFATRPRLTRPAPPCRHDGLLAFEDADEKVYAAAMGIDWMTNRESKQAIPPAFAEFLGRQMLAVLDGTRSPRDHTPIDLDLTVT